MCTCIHLCCFVLQLIILHATLINFGIVPLSFPKCVCTQMRSNSKMYRRGVCILIVNIESMHAVSSRVFSLFINVPILLMQSCWFLDLHININGYINNQKGYVIKVKQVQWHDMVLLSCPSLCCIVSTCIYVQLLVNYMYVQLNVRSAHHTMMLYCYFTCINIG